MVSVLLVRLQASPETLWSRPRGGAGPLPDASCFDLLITWPSTILSWEWERLQGQEEDNHNLTTAV